jgi:hypothetical protein
LNVFGDTAMLAIVPSGSYDPPFTSDPVIITVPPVPSCMEIFLHTATGGRTGLMMVSPAFESLTEARSINRTNKIGDFSTFCTRVRDTGILLKHITGFIQVRFKVDSRNTIYSISGK